ncbi:MAG: HAMP domain-containing histidine kinase [Actinomycetales bacterium]|nr:HAMP domain-containing histidine kinase [Actinomycetales bacterium]
MSQRTARILTGQNVPGTPGVSDGDGDHDPPPVDELLPAQRAGAIGVVVVGSTVAGGYLGDAGQEENLTADQLRTLAAIPPGAGPVDAELGGSLGDYRASARELPDGSVVVVALSLGEVDETVGQLGAIIGGVSVAALLLAVLLGAAVVRLALRPLDRVVATASRVSRLDLAEGAPSMPDRVPEEDADGATEVGRVGEALNQLLGNVESALSARHASEAKLRRFVADASHELRTPLASIRGYSEFVRRDAGDLDPDVQRSLERIDSESQRMTVIVEDLLLLARLDAGPAIAREPVDLALLVADAVSDAYAAGPDHRWELDLEGEEVPVIGDRVRLHQAVANLLANARTHTPPGTTVVTGVVARDGLARVTVVDDGPGIPPELQPRLFERFVRGDDSRARIAGAASGGSTGLGLAIVRAIVQAHGGSVEVASEPGRTAFTIELPLDDPLEPPGAATASRTATPGAAELPADESSGRPDAG